MRKQFFLSACVALCLQGSAMAGSRYISKVFEYRPAPGQFVNKLPAYADGDTPETMAAKAEASIAGTNRGLVSLGGYGGYIVVGFDRPVVNVPDTTDFRILGNAFWSAANPNTTTSRRGGSSEPGIVLVSADVNKNGLPDDEWYELAGSEYHSAATIRDYRISYFKPDENKVPTPDAQRAYLTDTTYVRWTTNGHGSGYVYRNSFHKQSYWPQWLPDDELVFAGSRLADNYVDESGNGSYFVQYAYDWGYADNAPNADRMSELDIDWAVDASGNRVYLASIDFVKVYTAVNQYCGWLGETSTEIMGAENLHPDAVLTSVDRPVGETAFQLKFMSGRVADVLKLESSADQSVEIFDITGRRTMSVDLPQGVSTIDCTMLPPGIYLLKTVQTSYKFIKL
ncbi:MAG: T9SS type A sorting domain-containing protein [Bacteroidales bacterium]|nr:T9SS type A sorting domain-containing protein [Bacteroidales bacterium]